MQRVLGSLIVAAVVPAAWAQIPSSDEQKRIFKIGLYAGCSDQGKQRGDREIDVDRFCGCLVKTLNENLKDTDWQLLLSASQGSAVDLSSLTVTFEKAAAACRNTTS